MEKQLQLVTVVYVDEVEIDELDHDMYTKFFGDNYYDDDEKEHPAFIGYRHTRGHPIDINVLINALEAFKEKGATHVSMEYHEDHIGYPIEALRIDKSTGEEVKDYLEGQLKKEQREKRRQRLLNQLKKLDEEQ